MNTLGCDKNLVDAEEMMSILYENGHEFTDDPTQAEIIIVNTCCFIEDAKKESIDAIIEAGEYKSGGCLKSVIATGCMAQRYAKEIEEKLPEVDAIVGIGGREALINAINSASDKNVFVKTDNDMKSIHAGERILSGGTHSAHLRIADGCDKYCTYCIIPHIRGRFRSIPEDELIASAKSLCEKGVRELILVAQETTLYGTDIYGEKRLPKLLKKLCEIDDLRWIRIMYAYPEEIDEELIDTIASENKICNYIDMPIQHINDDVLKAMNRKTTGADIRRKIDLIKKKIPDIALRTTLLTGFPGETDEMFEELKAFVAEEHFARLGVFPYSKEEGTLAAKMKNQVPKRTREKRAKELMLIQRSSNRSFGKSKINTDLDVMIEGYIPEDNIYVGRTYADAPEIDGLVFVDSKRELMSGDFIKAHINNSSEYDLWGSEI